VRKLCAVVIAAAALVACRSGQNPTVPQGSPSKGDAAGTQQLQWKTLKPALSNRGEVAAAAADGKIYVIAGFGQDATSVTTVEVYDTRADSWERGPPLPLAVNHPMAAAIEGTVYAFGGYTGSGLTDATDRAFRLTGDRWQEIPRMPEVRAAAGAVAAEGKLFIAGGIGPTGLAQSTLVFDPKANKWSTAPVVPTRREHLGVASDGTTIYVVGGRATGVGNLDTAEAFDASGGKWRTLPSMPTARGGSAAAASSNGFVVSAGGEADRTFAEAEAYDIKQNKWISLPPMPTARHGLGVASVGTVIYVLTGGRTPGFSFSDLNETIDLRGVRGE
jgi:N-acetylneuraminic acid mutarotase